eukprot:CAMPEP_0178672152 /NCGR_PEP_ID=MMETSP0698-20121128/33572_1 /TAXON_ID=265572 /ORGANISM="Extubocellulus spinifer, Strain CCMP396" /LENGTH=84 /DNA_ID=CAMNT_0020315989 /DNA_START=251 /DNA_END=505 /DNA_ORIENTATION=+
MAQEGGRVSRKCGFYYQQRVLLTNSIVDPAAILASTDRFRPRRRERLMSAGREENESAGVVEVHVDLLVRGLVSSSCWGDSGNS